MGDVGREGEEGEWRGCEGAERGREAERGGRGEKRKGRGGPAAETGVRDLISAPVRYACRISSALLPKYPPRLVFKVTRAFISPQPILKLFYRHISTSPKTLKNNTTQVNFRYTYTADHAPQLVMFFVSIWIHEKKKKHGGELDTKLWCPQHYRQSQNHQQ